MPTHIDVLEAEVLSLSSPERARLLERLIASLLSALPRGAGNLGFYQKAEQRIRIQKIQVAADVPEAERTPLQILRTDTPTFTALVKARRTRTEPGFEYPVGRIEVCNVPMPWRRAPPHRGRWSRPSP